MRYFRPAAVGWLGLLLAGLPLAGALRAAEDHCATCGNILIERVYRIEDQVTLEKRHVCGNCEKNFPLCFLCGLPAPTNAVGFAQIADGRVLCARDAKTAILREEDGLRVCREVRDGMDRMFSRFLSLPETNVTMAVVDRVHLQELFKFAGHDYQCPNVWGFTQSRTNHNRLEHRVSILDRKSVV
jgi:hypothetical protein